jgi:diamine N-acetyltransferase
MKPNSAIIICQDQVSSLLIDDLILIQRIIAGVGIVIQNKDNRSQNIGSEALQLLIEYFYNLNLHQLYANIGTENAASTALLLNLI